MLILAVAAFGCNTDDNDLQPQDPAPGSPTGHLQLNRMIYAPMFSSGDTQDYQTAAFAVNATDSAYTYAGTVLCNGDTLGYDPDYGVYGSGNNPVTLNMNAPATWVVAGSSTVPACSYTHGGVFPQLTEPFPDTLDKSAGLTISLPSLLQGADSFSLYLTDGATTLEKKAAAGGAFVLSASELSPFVVFQSGLSSSLHAWSTTDQVFSGKTIRFSKNLTIYRTLTLVE